MHPVARAFRISVEWGVTMSCSDCQAKMLPHIFRVETPVAIATAAHVVEHADDWRQPIKLTQSILLERSAVGLFVPG